MGNIQRASKFISAALYLLWQTAATLGIVLAVALCLFQDHAEAMTYCIDLGGNGWDCQEVSGWKSVVTQVQDAGGWNNAGGVCSYADYPKFRAGTLYVEYTDSTCQGQVLRNWFYWVCVDNYPKPSVGYQTGPAEIPYNGNDEDCNPATPDDDLDGDGHRVLNVPEPNRDCNDNDNKVYPGAKEECDKKDNNCNNVVDEGCEGGPRPESNLGSPCNRCPCP